MVYQRMRSIIVLLLLVSIISLAQEKVWTPDDVMKVAQVVEAAPSPDGNSIAYISTLPRTFSEKAGADYRELYILDISTKKSNGLITGKNSLSSIQWSPDGKQIYFLARLGDAKSLQVYSIDAKGGSSVVVTTATNSISQFKVHPKGDHIAFVSNEGHTSKKKDLLTKGFDAEFYEEEYFDLNLYMHDIKADISKRITSGFSVFDFHWSPDGEHIAAFIADKNLVDDSYMYKNIFLVNPENGMRTKIVETPGKLTSMAWCSDSKHIAFVAGVDVNDPVSGSLFVVDINNPKPFSELTNYTEGFIGSVTGIKWLNNETIIYSSEESVYNTIRSQKLGEAKSEFLLEPDRVAFSNFFVTKNDLVLIANTSEHPGELFHLEMDKKELVRLTFTNKWMSDFKYSKQEKITYKAKDGLEIEGVLIYPLDFKEGTRYPLIAYIHGGPEASVSHGWLTGYGSWGQVASARGYFLFAPNYRASSGRGVEFAKMDRGDLVGAEFQDVLDGIDYLIEKGFVDKSKVGIGGGSYGGYFAAWGATKHTERFAASVVFVGVSNQISKSHTTDIPFEDYAVHWGIWPFENFDLYLDRSPVKYAHKSKTPTLILHGKEDPRVHPAQSLELYRIMKLHSKAPVRLVLYPGEGHGNRKNTSRYDYLVRTLEWFDYYLKSDKPKNQIPDKYIDFRIE
jgi:dipeptidyl aminopeptidase/acylaminoacyl peptidase